MSRALKKRFCECGRDLDKYQHRCSECAYIHNEINRDWHIAKNKIKINQKQLAYYHKTKILRSEWKQKAIG